MPVPSARAVLLLNFRIGTLPGSSDLPVPGSNVPSDAVPPSALMTSYP